MNVGVASTTVCTIVVAATGFTAASVGRNGELITIPIHLHPTIGLGLTGLTLHTQLVA